MIYATGDTHGNFERFREEYFPEQASMTKDDYVIVCGDFGGVWDGGKQEQKRLDRLDQLPFTLLFVSGNHENFDLLAEYPVEDWNGGKVQRIRPHVIHLLRGQVFQLQGHSFFTMGGGKSHDIKDGILSPFAEDFREQYLYYRSIGAQFRINHRSWWKEEMPSQEEYREAEKALEQAGWEVDYIVTHAAPNHIVDLLSGGAYGHDPLTDFLETIRQKAKFHYWLFGHYHDNRIFEEKYVLLWEQMVRVL